MSKGSVAPKSPAWMFWTGWVITVLPVLGLIMSATMKVTNSPQLIEGMGKFGWNTKLVVPLAITELTCTILYLIPQTATLGAILLTGYLGGAIATHVRVGDNFAAPVIVAVLVWLGLFLREPRLRAILPIRM